MLIIDEDTLMHYGVPGMKWGKRKSGVSTARIRVVKSEDKRKADEYKKKPKASLSNQELSALNTRLSLEKKYSDLSRNDKASKVGANYVKGALAVVATATTIYNLTNNPMVRRGADIVGAAIKNKTAGRHSA
jgi:hypothetical protein